MNPVGLPLVIIGILWACGVFGPALVPGGILMLAAGLLLTIGH
jgi:hypothetical protein